MRWRRSLRGLGAMNSIAPMMVIGATMTLMRNDHRHE